jgi:hypothetical protein
MTEFYALIKKYWYAIPVIIIGYLVYSMFAKKKRRTRRRRSTRTQVRRSVRRSGRKLKFGSPAWRKRYIKPGRRKKRKK